MMSACRRSAYGEPAGSRPVEEEELIYGLSWFLPPGVTREMRATGGVVRMIGFGGLLVGIFDLFRHPAPKRLAESPIAAGEPKQQ